MTDTKLSESDIAMAGFQQAITIAGIVAAIIYGVINLIVTITYGWHA
jgi:hypothetical protein